MITALPNLILMTALAFGNAHMLRADAMASANRLLEPEDATESTVPIVGVAGQAAVRCAAAFALVAGRQARGEAQVYPPLAARGREYMVRVGSALIETGSSEAQVGTTMRDAAVALADPVTLAAVMPPCLSLLDAEVPQLLPPTLPQCVAIARRAGKEELADRLEAQFRTEVAAAGRPRGEADAILAAEAAGAAAAASDGLDASACEALAKAG